MLDADKPGIVRSVDIDLLLTSQTITEAAEWVTGMEDWVTEKP